MREADLVSMASQLERTGAPARLSTNQEAEVSRQHDLNTVESTKAQQVRRSGLCSLALSRLARLLLPAAALLPPLLSC